MLAALLGSLLLLPGSANADAVVGDYTISGDTDYSYSAADRALTITGDGTYRISMAAGVTSAVDVIVIAPSVDAEVTINGLTASAPRASLTMST